MSARMSVRMLVAALAVTALPQVVLAGPLTPPPGPVGPTNKTLSEVEPRVAINATNTPGDSDATPSVFKITQPGSYYLTGNITGVTGKIGIEVASGGVTIDLNGFVLGGVPGSLAGIACTESGMSSIAVRNGTIRGWGGAGVSFAAIGLVNNAQVSSLVVSGNGGGGIRAGYRCAVTECTVYSNTGIGISVGSDSTVSNCRVSGSTGDGINGTVSVTVTGCVSNENTGSGIAISSGVITGCVANSNTLNGINNSAGGVITACVANHNGGHGFNLSYGTISNSTARNNTLNGISVSSGCTILNNTCAANGVLDGVGAGIFATGNDNRIEGNNCMSADYGIRVTGIGNVIVRNSVSGNSTANWSISSSNVYGPIVDRTSPGSASVNGNAAADASGSTHPNANFTY